jgi:polysaccharide pyruvyl transferase WcaK-like protein
VGVVLVHPQKEYKGGLHAEANAALERLTASREMVRVPIDTRLDVNRTGLRTAAEIETAIARMDVVVTTRLHGTVLALKNGVPVVAVDPIAGGAKIRRQAETIGWPALLTADTLTDETLRAAFEFCLTPEARALAAACRERARLTVSRVREEFIAALTTNRNAPQELTR